MNTKKLIALLLSAAMLCCILCACQLSDANTPSEDQDLENTPAASGSELDLNDAVAKINGETVLTLNEVKTTYDMYVELFTSYGYDVTSDEATRNSFLDDLVDSMMEDKIIAAKARELGYNNYTEEQQAELDAAISTQIEGLNDYYREVAEEEAAADDSIDVEARTMELILEEAVANLGREDATYEEYCQKLSDDVEAQFLYSLLQAAYTDDVAAAESDIEALYVDTVATDLETYQANPEYYKEDADSYESSLDGIPPLYVPQDYHRIYDIYVAFEGTVPQECTDAQTNMNNLKSEYCQLAFADALAGTGDNAARLAEIISEYKEQQTIYDDYYAQYTASAYAKIEAAYERLEAGEDFKTVMLEVTENTDFTEIDGFANGMLISNSYSSNYDWSTAVKNAFSTMQLGTYSPVFVDTNGLHIIYYVSDEVSGTKELDEVHDAIAKSLTEDVKTETWNSLIAEWKNDDSVQLFAEVYRQLGK